MGNKKERTFSFGGASITQSEYDACVEHSMATGVPIQSSIRDYVYSKNPNVNSNDVKALTFKCEAYWHNTSGHDSLRQARRDEGKDNITAEQKKEARDAWRDVLNNAEEGRLIETNPANLLDEGDPRLDSDYGIYEKVTPTPKETEPAPVALPTKEQKEPEMTEKTYDYGSMSLTQSELDACVNHSVASGERVEHSVDDLLKAKYGDEYNEEEGKTLASKCDFAWQEDAGVLTSSGITKIHDQYLAEHGLTEADVANENANWNNTIEGVKNGTPIPVDPKNLTQPVKTNAAFPKTVSLKVTKEKPTSPDVEISAGSQSSTIKDPSPTLIGAVITTYAQADAIQRANTAAMVDGVSKAIKGSISAAGKLTSKAADVIKNAGKAYQEAKASTKKLVSDAVSATKNAAASIAQNVSLAASAVKDSTTNFFTKAMNTFDDWVDAANSACNKALDATAEFLAPMVAEAEATLAELPGVLSEYVDNAKDVVSSASDYVNRALDIMTDKAADVLFDALYDDNGNLKSVAALLESAYEKLESPMAENLRHAIVSGIDTAVDKLSDAAKTAVSNVWKKITSNKRNSEYDDFYMTLALARNREYLARIANRAKEIEDEYTTEVVTPTSNISITKETSKVQDINRSEITATRMNNAILDAISKYLPGQYRNVEYLPSIPHDVLKAACDQMEYDLKNNDDNHLTVSDQERITNIMWLASGLGGYHNQLQTFMTALNRFGGLNVTPSAEHVGLTFITRPRLCLQSSNIRNNRILTTLDTLNNSTMAFAIRCLLDSNFANANNGLYRQYVSNSPVFDQQNPFLVPLCNALTSFNGSPDIDIESTTTDGGYMSEAQTFAIGGSNLQRGNYSLTLNFQEVAHNPVMAILYYWLEYIRCVTRGSLLAYADDIDAQRLNYTVSIYRFVLDPTNMYITKYAKYTGCYPTGLPIGSAFNFGAGDVEVSATKNLSITFNCNKVEYMDYAILMDFNTLMRRYCPVINKATKQEMKTRYVRKVERVRGTKNVYVYNIFTGKYESRVVQTPVYYDQISYEAEQYLTDTDVDHIEYDDNGNLKSGYSMKCPVLPVAALSNFRGLPYIVSDRNGFRLEFRQHPSPAFNNLTNTLADQLLYLDMINRLNGELTNYDTITGMYTPDYGKKADAYRNVDIGEFIRRAFADKATSDLLNPV